MLVKNIKKTKNNNKIYFLIFSCFILLISLTAVFLPLCGKPNVISNRLSTSNLLKKSNDNFLIDIKLDIPPDEAIVMTDLEPETTFKILNYDKLVNLDFWLSDPTLVSIQDHKNGKVTLRVLKRGTGYLTIIADNALNPYQIKIDNGLFKKNDILYVGDKMLVTKRGVILTNTDDYNPTFNWLFTNIWPNPKKEDIVSSSRYILATKYGIFDTFDGKKILTNVYKSISLQDILEITDEIIITKKGIFNYLGEQIAKDEYPVVFSGNIFQLKGNIVITDKGTFNSKGKKLFSYNEQVKYCIYDIHYYFWKSVIVTKYGIFDSDRILLSRPSQITNGKHILCIFPNDYFGSSQNFIVTRYGVYNFTKDQFYSDIDYSQVIKIGNKAIVTKNGFYSFYSTKKFNPGWYTEIKISDIIYMTEEVIYTTRGLLYVRDLNKIYQIDLVKDSIYNINHLDQWFGLSSVIKNLGLYSFSLDQNREILNQKNHWKLYKNEILKIGSLFLWLPDSYYLWNKGNEVTNKINYCDSVWKLSPTPTPEPTPSPIKPIIPNSADKNARLIIIATLFGVTFVLIFLVLLTIVPRRYQKHKKIKTNVKKNTNMISPFPKEINKPSEILPKNKVFLLASKNHPLFKNLNSHLSKKIVCKPIKISQVKLLTKSEKN